MNAYLVSTFSMINLVLAFLFLSTYKTQGNGKSVNQSTKVIRTTYGPIRGKIVRLPTKKLVEQYLGVRFAKAARFENPISPDEWKSTIDAFSFGKACPQPVLPGLNGTLPLKDLSEDCLFLNVFVPVTTQPKTSLPVMHWIHGGGYIFGTSKQPGLEILASEGNVIVVSSNYRLGALGFLATGENSLKGNYGMLDQIKAMKWIRSNIKRFGGDPNRVTIFGMSAGGFSVSLQMLSPLTSGLFQNVIAQSGVANTLMAYLTVDQARERAREFGSLLSCSDLTTLKDCLNGKQSQEIAMAIMGLKSKQIFLPFTPVVDGNYLPDKPQKLINEGKLSGRNVMLGFTRDEGSFFMLFSIPSTFPAFPGINQGMSRSSFKQFVQNSTWIRNQNNQNLDTIIFQYTNWINPDHPNVTRQSCQDLISDSVIKAPTIQKAKALVKDNRTTYLYQFEHGPVFHPFIGRVPQWMAAFHSADLTYVFGNPLLQPGANEKDPDVKFSLEVMKMWSNFARTGNPTPHNSLPQWPRYTLQTQKLMALKPKSEVRSHYRAEYMEFWNGFLPTRTGIPPMCVEQRTGTKLPHPTDCGKYYEFLHGKFILRDCARGTYFSAAMKICTWPHLSGCIIGSKQ